jgi:hypothetical protein
VRAELYPGTISQIWGIMDRAPDNGALVDSGRPLSPGTYQITTQVNYMGPNYANVILALALSPGGKTDRAATGRAAVDRTGGRYNTDPSSPGL